MGFKPVLSSYHIVGLSCGYQKNIFSFFKEETYVFKKNLKSTTPSSYALFYFKKFAGYEYVGFQFSKNDGYAQRLCISIF
jgi:hypothetical protein